jgi:hypothetical protein
MIPFYKYYTILLEDLQSSLNQAKNILQNNGVARDELDIIIRNLNDGIYQSVTFEDPQNRVANKDANIPALAFWYCADPNFDRIREDYRQYINTRSLYQKNFLTNSMENLKREISNRKLFKPSEEKLSLIKQTFTKVAETIHSQYKPVVKSTDKKFVPGSTNDDVAYDNDEIIIYKADSKAKCIQYGAGSSLCISVKGGGNYYWSYRMGNMHHKGLGMTTYFVYWKDGSNRILIDALGDEDGPANKYSWNPIKPNTDMDITSQELINIYPILAGPFSENVFQFEPWGEKEKRFQWISENVHYLLDPQLKTLEDYEMFIENFEDGAGEGLKYEGWNAISKKLGEEPAAYIVKKYAGLGNLVDVPTQERFLTPKDREWYWNIIINQEDPSDLLEYCAFVKGMNIPEQLIRKIISYSGYMWEYLKNIVRLEEDTSSIILNAITSYFSTEDLDKATNSRIDFLMGRNITPELLAKIFENLQSFDMSDVTLKLIEYYQKNNIVNPKPLIRVVVSDPNTAYKYHRNWIKTKKTPPPKILLKTILKKPVTAFLYAKDLKWSGKEIPEEVENVILKDLYLAYQYIDQGFNYKGFENYPTEFLVKLFSSGVNGYRYVDEKHGFGIFRRGWKSKEADNKKIRRVMMKNIMDNPKLSYERLKYGNYSDMQRKDEFFKLVRMSAKQYNKESFKPSQMDIILELARQVK